MTHKNKPIAPADFQDAGTKKAKRIASIIYVCVMAFIVGGSYLHQQQQAAENSGEDLSGFSNP